MGRILLFIVLLSNTFLSLGAAVNFTAKVSHETVEEGQRIQITFTVNSGAGNFTPPSFPGFQLLSGPNQSSSVQIINGKRSRNTSISYILQATELGSHKIGEASIKVDGKTYKTKPLTVKVVDANSNSANAQRNRQNQRRADGQSEKKNVFIRATIDKRKAVVGEKVTVTYRLYSKPALNLIDFESQPSFSGFWTHDLAVKIEQQNLKQERINGEVYSAIDVKQTVLYPQRNGELTIDPLELRVTVQVRSRRSRSVFDQMFGSYEKKVIIAKSNPLKVQIEALPKANKPVDFSGAVGAFSMKMSTNKDSVMANEAIDVKIEVKGSGNLPLIGAPKLNFPPDFEVYDPETKDKFKIGYEGAKGTKTFNYLVIPRHSGNFKLDPFSFSYFDLKSKTYKNIDGEPIEITVSKGNEEENVVYSSSRKEEVELLNTDIRYIHINPVALISANDLFYGSSLFYFLVVFSILLFLAVYFFSKKYKAHRADTIGIRKSKANKLAKKRLSRAKTHLDSNQLSNFYEEISTALFGYFADKFIISTADLSQDKIVELLNSKNLEISIGTEVRQILEEAEMARFAPSSAVDANSLYERSVSIISKIEGNKA